MGQVLLIGAAFFAGMSLGMFGVWLWALCSVAKETEG